MLEIKISNKKPKPVVSYLPYTYKPAGPAAPEINPIFTKAHERNKIVQELYADCKYKPGDTVKDKQDVEYIVQHICKSYAELGNSYEWPSTDNPMIVTIKSKTTNALSFCTTNYVSKV